MGSRGGVPTVVGANVLVTGGSSGIGAALARRLAGLGANVGIVGRRADKLAQVLAECRAANPACRSWTADLGDLEGAERLALEAWDAFGHLDVLVNNAAIPKVRPAVSLTAADVEEAMRVNFLSPARMTLALLPRMIQRGGGVIVNVASMGGRLGISHEAAYCASKFALSGWSEALAMDLDGTGVAVRLIQPGPIATDIRDRPGEPPPVTVPDLEPPELVADGIVAAIESDTFEHYLPDLKSVVTWKESDIDTYIKVNADMRREAEQSSTTTSPVGS
jgi:NAD(P)-dependent dehydrogenase (short-subunit alcohol dehydrogenase family)